MTRNDHEIDRARTQVTELFGARTREVALWPVMLERQLENAPPGIHICPIYSSSAERLRVLVAFFGGALRHGEQCLYFADPDRAEELARALEALGARAGAELERGALQLVTTRDQYVRNGHFEPRAMIELQEAMTSRARSSGFSALRVAGEMSWVLGADSGNERFLEYEALLNSTAATSGRSIVCQYDWRQNQAPVIRDVLRTHPVAIIDERVHDNVYYEPIDLVLGRGDVDRARTEWMVRLLQGHTRRVTALFDLGRLTLDGASPGALMAAAPALMATELQLDHVQVFELLPSADAVRLVGSFGSDRVAIGSVEQLIPDSLFTNAALRAGEPVVVSDGHGETRFKLPAVLREAGATGIVISIGRGERVYGFLSVHSRASRIFSDDEILFLEAVGHLLASAFAAAQSALSYRALVENAPDVIVRFGGDLRIIYANPAIERVTGIAAGSLIGKTSTDLGILEPLVPRWELLMGQVWRTGREQTFELTVPTPTDQRVFESRIVPESGPDGAVQSLLTISRDVTEQRRAETDRLALYQQVVSLQNRVLELTGRLAQDRQRMFDRISPASQLEQLTDRERQILRLLAAGRTNREIGAEIGLTAGTVKNQVARILSKLSVTDRTQAAVRAVELGLVGSGLD